MPDEQNNLFTGPATSVTDPNAYGSNGLQAVGEVLDQKFGTPFGKFIGFGLGTAIDVAQRANDEDGFTADDLASVGFGAYASSFGGRILSDAGVGPKVTIGAAAVIGVGTQVLIDNAVQKGRLPTANRETTSEVRSTYNYPGYYAPIVDPGVSQIYNPSNVNSGSYTVRAGDTLSGIAQSNGISLGSLIAANPQISNPDRISIGQSVNIYSGAGTSISSTNSISSNSTVGSSAQSPSASNQAIGLTNTNINSNSINLNNSLVPGSDAFEDSYVNTGRITYGGDSGGGGLSGGGNGGNSTSSSQGSGLTNTGTVPGSDATEDSTANTYGGRPVLLDLNGDGIEVTQLRNSGHYYDLGGDGTQHRTAWAGQGDGVLVRDAGNDGQINQANEIDFTYWDASAKSDMEALRNAFDTNRNGKLDAGDADFTHFKVLVTNSDGTTTLKTLAELGIESIGLISNNQTIRLQDGSAIQGSTTFTRSDGTTGTAADVVLAYDADGHNVTQTISTSTDGTTTITSTAYDENGALAETVTTTTSSDGLSKTVAVDRDGDGVRDSFTSDVTVVGSSAETTRTQSYFDGSGTILLSKEVTTTSADRRVVSISRDADGSGSVDSIETRTTGSDGSLTLQIKGLNPDGSLRGQSTTTTSATGLNQTIQTDRDGDGALNATRVVATSVAADGTRTETRTEYAGTGTAAANKIGQMVTTYRADGTGKRIVSDLDGDGDTDVIVDHVIERKIDGSSVVTSTTSNADNSLRSRTVTTLSADGNTEVVSRDSDGDSVYETKITQVTTVAANGDVHRTVTATTADGAWTNQGITTWNADGSARSSEIDTDGDGVVDKLSRVEIVNGEAVETVFSYSPDGSILLSKDVRTTSGDGLTGSGVGDADGDGVSDVLVNGTVTTNAAGDATRTNVIRAGDETEIARVVANVTADGLGATVQQFRTGATAPELTLSGTRTLNSDGSVVDDTTIFEGANEVQTGRTVTSRSADKLSEIQSRFLNTNTNAEQIRTTQVTANGDVTQTSKLFSPDGATLLTTKTSTSSGNGLDLQTTWDVDGNGTTDATIVASTDLNADGSVSSTASSYAGSGIGAGQKTGERTITTSANGLSTTTLLDRNGDGTFDQKMTKIVVLNADGSKTTTETVMNGAGTVQVGKTVTTVSDDGLSRTITTYLGSRTTADSIVKDTFKIEDDGTKSTVSETYNADHSLRNSVVSTKSVNGLVTTTKSDFDGDGGIDRTVVTTTKADGSKEAVSETFDASGQLTSRSNQTTDGTGRVITTDTDLSGDGTIDRKLKSETVVNGDGTRVVTGTDYEAAGSIKGRSVVTMSADGSSMTTQLDGSGTGSFTRAFTNSRSVEADGSVKEVLPNPYAAATSGNVTRVTSADGKTTTTKIDRDGNGSTDQTIEAMQRSTGEIITSQMNGEVKSAGGRLFGAESGRYETLSSNGLVRTIRYDDNGDGLAERQTVQTTTLASNGTRTTETVRSNLSGGTASVANPTYTAAISEKSSVTSSANGQSSTYAWDLNGDGSTDRTGSSQTTFATDGSTTNSRTLHEAGALKSKFEITTSADGLTTTTKQDADGSGNFENVSTDTSARSANGSIVRTVTLRNESGALLSKTVTTTSADNRTQTLAKDLDGSGSFEETVSASLKSLADGSSIETRKTTDGQGRLLDKSVSERSFDGRETTLTLDSDGNGTTDQIATMTVKADGSSTGRITDIDATGKVVSVRNASMSWDGRSWSEERDFDGNGSIDEIETREIKQGVDGSSQQTSSTFKANVLTEKVIVTTRADGQVCLETDVDGDGDIDKSAITNTRLDGSVRTVASANAAAQADKPEPGTIAWASEVATDHWTVAASSVTETRADGAVSVTNADYDGDGTFEHTRTMTTRLDGSMSGTMVEKRSNGTVAATGTLTVSADGKKTVLTKDIGGNGSIEERQELVVAIDGQQTKTTTLFNSDSSVKSTTLVKVFANGELKSSVVTGTSGNDTLHGTAENDRLEGGAGNDTIYGLDGDDTLVGGSGGDVLNGGSGTDFVSYETAGAGVTLKLWTTGEGSDAAGDTFVDIEGVIGSAYADKISGQNHIGEIIRSGLGNDEVYGFGGDDTIDGGGGNDRLIGGTGNDTLIGGAGSDTYFYYGGDGDDVIQEGAGSGDTDKLFLGEGIYPADLIVKRSSSDANDAVLTSRNGPGSVTLKSQFSTDAGGLGIEQIVFNDGTVWDRAAILAAAGGSNGVINGTSGNDTLTGTGVDEAINGLGGNDTLKGMGGADTLDGGAGTDTADYSDKTAAVVVTLNGSTNATVTVGGTAEDTIRNIENLIGGSGNDQLTGDSLDNVLTGAAGNDTLKGGAGNDTLIGGAGADRLDGGAGNDFVSYAGSTAAVTVRLWTTGEGGDAQGDTYVDVEGVVGSSHADVIYGQDHVGETLRGEGGNDQLIGGGGDDTLEGGAGNDFLDGGSGNDTLRGGEGDDTLFGWTGADVLDGGAGTDIVSYANSSSGVTVHLWTTGDGGDAQGDSYIDIEGVIGSSHADKISGQNHIGESLSGGAGNDELYGFGGDDTLDGGTGNDFLQGGTGNDILLGGDGDDQLTGDAGNDKLTGGAGNDTFIFDPGFGKDVITDFVAGAGSQDVIEFDHSIFADYAALSAAAVQSGSDVLITVDSANTLTLKNVSLSSLHTDDFRFV